MCTNVQIRKVRHNSRIESSLGCTRSTVYEKAPFCKSELTFVAYVDSALLNSIFSDNPKSLISRINEVYVFFNKISPYSDTLLYNNNNINFIIAIFY